MTASIVVAPLRRHVGPEGPIYTYSVGGARVTARKPMSPEDLAAAGAIVEAGRRALLEMIGQQIDLEREE